MNALLDTCHAALDAGVFGDEPSDLDHYTELRTVRDALDRRLGRSGVL